ncbi:Acyl-CoA dehydrogenase [Novosphingobium sp. 9U]|nr:Acyl-CoA dehydrogenase [Novosphingobium sp. 9U]
MGVTSLLLSSDRLRRGGTTNGGYREWTVNFDLSEDEEMLKALADRFVADRYDHDSRRAFLAEPCGFSSSNWQLLGELGLIAAPFAEDLGGLDLDATGVAIVFEALGRGLVVEPLAESVMMAGRLFAMTAREPLLNSWIEAVVSGEKRLALAALDERARDGLCWLETCAVAKGDSWRLSGTKPFCAAGGGADAFIVPARIHGEPGDRTGVALFLIPATQPGASLRPWHMADGSVAVALTLEDVMISDDHKLDRAGDDGLAAIDAANELADLARSAEALGIMERLFADTIDYLRTRSQFGAAIGSFQAIQHRMVAQYAVIEQARALLNLALVSSESAEFGKAVQGARAFLARTSLELGHEMIQFHGGMGITDELAIGAGHKRLLVLSRWPESPQATLDRYAGVLA